MAEQRVGVIMNGVTGRMGTHQHLLRSLVAIIKQGGVRLAEGEYLVPDPILVGRSDTRLRHLAELAQREGVAVRRTTDLDAALADPQDSIYFDAQLTRLRAPAVTKAIEAGKHIYCEKPSGVTTGEAYELYRQAKEKGVRHGVVQDKLFLPGLLKLKNLIDTGFFGEILSVRGEFGYWVFTGHDAIPIQRPSWNYRREEGGGIIVDMLCHWRYVLDNLFGEVRAVSCLGATHVRERVDENGEPYVCTADDAAYATFELANGIIAQFNSSWTVRVRRDDLLTVQVDGTKGTAVAGLRNCVIQPYGATPRPVWNPDLDSPIDFYADWMKVPTNQVFDNGFKTQWEMFLRHVALGTPFPHDLREGAKGVQLAEAGLRSWSERRWITLEELPT
ncbi:MAG: Gfo/Idh/MocA family oxidoreductase [Capsulimonadales bacterium]|nr:Gfo/Idh/MocA family oxidoreductase [Capsulimonadales bacterium]